MDARMLYLHVLSSLHCGVGQSAGVIDLPTARDRVTEWPLVPASTVKGVLRESAVARNAATAGATIDQAFGPDITASGAGATAAAGALLFPDLHVLCLPVRSWYGTVAWISCPQALADWGMQHTRFGLEPPELPPATPGPDAILTGRNAAIGHGAPQRKVYLEDHDLAATEDDAVATVAGAIAAAVFATQPERDDFAARFGIVHDDLFTALCQLGMEVVDRIRIDQETGTVAGGALWREERVPAETIFTGALLADPPRTPTAPDSAALFGLVDGLLGQPVQVGGDASVGRGLARLRLGSEVRS